MIEEKLENFRKVYISSGSKLNVAPDILAHLPAQTKPHAYRLKALIVILTVVSFSGSVLGVSQAASPGTTLYPVKLASDEILAKVTGRQELKIEKRAQEVIESANASQKQQDQALKEFQKALEETEEEAKKSGKFQEFQKALDNEKDKLKKAQEKNPSKQLEEAIKSTKKNKGEIQGQKDPPEAEKEDHKGQNSGRNQEDEDSKEDRNGQNQGSSQEDDD